MEKESYLILKEKGTEKLEFFNEITLNCLSDGCKRHGPGNKENNIICSAIEDIQWFCTYIFPIEGNLPDPVKMTVLEIDAQPLDKSGLCACNFKVRILFTSSYNQREILNTIRNHVFCNFVVEQE